MNGVTMGAAFIYDIMASALGGAMVSVALPITAWQGAIAGAGLFLIKHGCETRRRL